MQRFRRAAQKFFLLTIFLTAALLTTACGGEEPTKGTAQTKASKTARFEDTYKAEDTWVIYWYVCGTDLETESGAASADIQELLEVPLPPNVKVVAQTGGTNQWQNNV
ncbi:MAG: clostripain, partial [Selenomonadaceae bacterium]|nr:clostripain [Selenomonadaceae bacterium]